MSIQDKRLAFPLSVPTLPIEGQTSYFLFVAFGVWARIMPPIAGKWGLTLIVIHPFSSPNQLMP